jgi:cephalosporin-C deacetylase-like acetyl esterase
MPDEQANPTEPTSAASKLQELLSTSLLTRAVVLRDFQRFLSRRIPSFLAPADTGNWLQDAERLRQRVLSEVVFKGVPPEVRDGKPRIELTDKLIPGSGYSIQKLRYEAYPGMWVPSLLYLPDRIEGKVPVVLNVNGHVGPPGKSIEYEQIRCINLAKRGLISLHPEWLVFGELSAAGNAHNKLAYLDLCGFSGLSIFYLHLKHGLDVLLDLPQADPDRVAVTGLSGGGWQTIVISALDTRVTAAIPNAGYIGELWRVFAMDDVGDGEQQPNDLVKLADYVHLTALLAPRAALLIYNAYDDCCFLAHRAWHSVFLPVKPLYQRLGAADRFEFHENQDPGTHNYDLDNRQALYRFLNQHFLGGGGQDEEIPSASEVLTQEELTVGIPADNATFASIACQLSRDLPRNRAPLGDAAHLTAWRGPARQMLRELVRYPDLPLVEATLQSEQQVGAGNVRTWELRPGAGWTLPAVECLPAHGADAPVAVIVADEGKSSCAELAAQLWASGHRVVALDIFPAGELARHEPSTRYFYTEMAATVGERTLGIQAAQLRAVMEWASRGAPSCALYATGRAMSVAAVIATALDVEGRVSTLVTCDLPASLKLLFEQDAGYEEQAPLYCFGLLEQFDIRELPAMCAGRHVECHRVWGGSARIDAELGGLHSLPHGDFAIAAARDSDDPNGVTSPG